MGLEALTPNTYISGLTAEWPTAGEPKSQGDDHIRLIKGVLKNTFPNATAPMYGTSVGNYPGGSAITLTPQDAGKILFIETATAVTVALPLLTVSHPGWSIEVFKYSVDQNAVTVVPNSGVIYTQVGGVATVRVGVTASIAKFIWNGSAWFCSKPGPPVGSTIIFDGATIPAGYLPLDGGTFNTTAFAELNIALGGGTLRDKRGRVDVGMDGGTSRLANAMPGQYNVLGGVGGLDYHYLTADQMPSHLHGASMYDPGHGHPVKSSSGNSFITFGGGGNTSPPPGSNTLYGDTISAEASGTGTRVWNGVSLDATYAAGGGNWHPNVQPTIVSNKIVRAC